MVETKYLWFVRLLINDQNEVIKVVNETISNADLPYFVYKTEHKNHLKQKKNGKVNKP